MNAIAAAIVDDDAQEGVGSVSSPRVLSAQQRFFADTFVANGGKGDEAAIAAGIAPDKAAVQACRWLCRKPVADHIKNLCGTFVHSQLPVAIRTLVEIAGDPQALRKDRIKAANSLLDIGQMTSPKGGLQVNVGIVNGSQAQQIISEVHQRRQARLSDIPPAMPDTQLNDIEQAIEATATAIGDQAGGDHLQGPAAGSVPLPVSPSEHLPQPDVSGPDPASRFRSAFEDDGE